MLFFSMMTSSDVFFWGVIGTWDGEGLLVIQARDKEELANEEEGGDGGHHQQVLRGGGVLDDHLSGDGEEEDLHDRTQVVPAEHFQELNADDDGKGGGQECLKAIHFTGICSHKAQLVKDGDKGKENCDDHQDADQNFQ